MTEHVFYENVMNEFYVVLEQNNPDLSERISEQLIQISPWYNGTLVNMAFKNVSDEEKDFINLLLSKVYKNVIREDRYANGRSGYFTFAIRNSTSNNILVQAERILDNKFSDNIKDEIKKEDGFFTLSTVPDFSGNQPIFVINCEGFSADLESRINKIIK